MNPIDYWYQKYLKMKAEAERQKVVLDAIGLDLDVAEGFIAGENKYLYSFGDKMKAILVRKDPEETTFEEVMF